MVQAVHGENLTEGAERRRNDQRRGRQSFECGRKNREAEKNASEAPPLQLRAAGLKPAATGAGAGVFENGARKKKAPRLNRGAFETSGDCSGQRFARAWRRAAESSRARVSPQLAWAA